MELQPREMVLVWFSLTMEQQNHEVGSKMWFRHERLIRKLEKELGMSERPLVKEAGDMPIGKCPNCNCGTRPGPWHNKDCQAYMPSEYFE